MGGDHAVETRPSFMTSEFLGTVLAITALAIYNAVSDAIDPRLTWILITGMVVFYVLSRGIAKAGEPSRAFDPRDELRLGGDGSVGGRPDESVAAGSSISPVRHSYADWVETRPSFLTSEFLGTVLAITALAIHNAVSDGIDTSLTWILIIGLVAMYLISRGLAKSGTRSRAFDPREELGREGGWSDSPLSREREHSP